MKTHIGPDNREGTIDPKKLEEMMPKLSEAPEKPRDRYVLIFQNASIGWACCGLALNALISPDRDYFTKPVKYGDDFSKLVEELRPSDHVYVMDFSFDLATCDAIAAKVEKFALIDSKAKALGNTPYTTVDPAVSSAMLVYLHFFGDLMKGRDPMGNGFEYVPIPVRLLDHYNKWRVDDVRIGWEFVRGFHLYVIDFYGNYEFWRELMSQEELPSPIIGYIKKKNADFFDTMAELYDSVTLNWRHFAGFKYIMFPCSDPNYISLMSHELRVKNPDEDFIASYYLDGDKLVVSMRSVKDFSVLKIATENGGGGQDKAAGFTTKDFNIDDLQDTVRRMIDDVLAKNPREVVNVHQPL